MADPSFHADEAIIDLEAARGSPRPPERRRRSTRVLYEVEQHQAGQAADPPRGGRHAGRDALAAAEARADGANAQNGAARGWGILDDVAALLAEDAGTLHLKDVTPEAP